MNKYMDRAKTMREQLNTLIKDFNDEKNSINKNTISNSNNIDNVINNIDIKCRSD